MATSHALSVDTLHRMCVVLWLCKVHTLVLNWLLFRRDGSTVRCDVSIDVICTLALAVDACCRVTLSLTACVRASVVIVGTHTMT